MNKKIVIFVVALIIILVGGVLVWQFWPRQVEMPVVETPAEIRAPEEVEEIIKDEIADWKIYRNNEYGFEIKYPGELEARRYIINKETTGGCVIGEQVRFYFYTKGDERALNLFTGYLTSADYQELEVSIKDGSFCFPVFDSFEKIVLETPFQLLSTSLTVPKPIQSISCEINQTAEFSVGRYYNEKYNTFGLRFYHYDFPLLSVEDWKTECSKTFQENIQKLEARIKQFDLVAKSLKF